MNKKISTLSAVVGAAFFATAALSPIASAADATFSAKPLASGYTLAEHAEGKCGEAKCGADMKKSEAKCGVDKKAEGKCGEAKCGADKKAEAKCGAEMKKAEGKCGEAKCGADKKAH